MGYNMPCKKTIDWNDRIKCPDCKIQFQSHDCFEAHKHRACKHRKVCGKCFKLYNAIKNVHVCGHFYCRECKSSHPKNSKAKGEFHCYIQKAKINKKTDFAPILKIYYDFETVQTLKLIVTKKVRPYPNFDNLNSSNETFETPYLDDVTDAHPHHNEHADHHNIQSNPRIRFEVNNDENGFSRIRDTIELEDEFFNVVNNETSTLTNKNVHQVNTASCLVKCSKCFYETNLTLGCDLCNLNKIITWTSVPNAKPGVFFCDENEDQYPVNLFRDFIIDLSNKQPFTKIILYAHNSSRFDGHLLNRSFVKLGYAPQTIYRGFSIIQSIFKANGSIGCNIFLRDTIKLAPISLAKFAECFGIEDGIAKFEMFPYLLNEPKNYLSKLNMLPAKKYYGYDLMTTKKRAEFDQKYEEENIKMLLENRQFVFVDEIIKYVEMDVITLYR
uniref:DNA-directed DNA polymerase n=1 Tax=Panagrolaimus superbus TaxID=310955 RepID=A0A914Z784_9BILA